MVLPTLGPIPLSELKPSDVRGLQSELLSRNSLREKTPKKLSVKYVKNIISGSFRAMIAQARDDDLVTPAVRHPATCTPSMRRRRDRRVGPSSFSRRW
jgi:hypothetical protein